MSLYFNIITVLCHFRHRSSLNWDFSMDDLLTSRFRSQDPNQGPASNFPGRTLSSISPAPAQLCRMNIWNMIFPDFTDSENSFHFHVLSEDSLGRLAPVRNPPRPQRCPKAPRNIPGPLPSSGFHNRADFLRNLLLPNSYIPAGAPLLWEPNTTEAPPARSAAGSAGARRLLAPVFRNIIISCKLELVEHTGNLQRSL